jgi:hypothetical protein
VTSRSVSGLRRTIEWSHDLLDEPERHLFRGLGVFVGSCSLSAAEAVAGDAAPADRDVLDLLASLVDKSLVRVEASAGEPRFRMLEMIAEFARDRLAASDDAAAERHARFFRGLSIEIGAGVTGGDQRRWLSVLGGEEDGEAGNIRAALAWFLDHRRLDELADMAWALWVPAWINGRIEEGRRIAGAGLGLGGDLSELSRARLLVVLGTFEMWSGDHVAATESLRRGRELAVELGDDAVLAAATLAQSMIAGPVEGEARSEQLADDVLDIYERHRGDIALGLWYASGPAFQFVLWAIRALRCRRAHARGLVGRRRRAVQRHGRGNLAGAASIRVTPTPRALLTSCADRHRSLRLLYSVAYLLDRSLGWPRTGDPARGPAARRGVTAPRVHRRVRVGIPTRTP